MGQQRPRLWRAAARWRIPRSSSGKPAGGTGEALRHPATLVSLFVTVMHRQPLPPLAVSSRWDRCAAVPLFSIHPHGRTGGSEGGREVRDIHRHGNADRAASSSCFPPSGGKTHSTVRTVVPRRPSAATLRVWMKPAMTHTRTRARTDGNKQTNARSSVT